MRDFDTWLSTMRHCINKYSFYVDFDKVHKNVDSIKIELNILNSLIASQNIERDFKNLLSRYPEVLKCIPILLAVRDYEIYAQDDRGAFLFDFKKLKYSVDDYINKKKKTGLFDLLSAHKINNLVDYITGVEVGLDSNGRKNRGGHQMEELVEMFIKKTGVEYYKEMYLDEIEDKWKISLDSISGGGTSTKRFDFVVKTFDYIYLIETNFYSTGGSKLNETARSFKMLTEEVSEISGVKFMWITDGKVWESAKGNLKETFCILERLYNLNDLENGILFKEFLKGYKKK